VTDPQTAIMSFLYIGTFGSFIGYSFAFGLVLQNQFHRQPAAAPADHVHRPAARLADPSLGGWLSDRVGGTRVNLLELLLMGVPPGVPSGIGVARRWRCSPSGHGLFVFSGIGNGSTYQEIPATSGEGAPPRSTPADSDAPCCAPGASGGRRSASSRRSGAGWAVGSTWAFRQSFAVAKSGVPGVLRFPGVLTWCAPR